MKPRLNITDYRGQRVLLVGLGVHGGGIATTRWLVQQGAKVRVTDLQSAEKLAPAIKQLHGLPVVFHLGGYQAADWRWAERIVVNPAISALTHPQLATAERRGVGIENEASIFLRTFPGKTIGVTGTRGKTTTTLLLADMLKRANAQTIVSGNVRQVPMLSYLPKTTSSNWAVLELSSYQLERLPVPDHPIHVAIMTNLKVDHVSYHGSLKAYAEAKYNIFRGQTEQDYKILNWHDPACRRARTIGQGNVKWFGQKLPKNVNGVTVQKNWVIEQHSGATIKLFPLTLWKLSGQHNLDNVLAAVAGALTMNVAIGHIKKSVQSFHGVPYRQQLIRTYRGHQMINDSAATSPDATLAALPVYPRGVYIIGGTDKQLDFRTLAKELVRRNIQTVFLAGSATVQLQKLLEKMHYRQPLITVHSMSSAVSSAVAIAKPKQEIILSPGAASFGLFRHEFDRGDQFNEVVKNLS